jgi:hypothetical protein
MLNVFGNMCLVGAAVSLCVFQFGDTFLVKLTPTCFRYQLLRSTCEATTRDFILHILIGYLIGILVRQLP